MRSALITVSPPMCNTDNSVAARLRAGSALGICVMLLGPVGSAFAQQPTSPAGPSESEQVLRLPVPVPLLDDAVAAAGSDAQQQPPVAEPAPVNPFDQRPVCSSMFMKTDWQLTRKQRACDWIHNGVFSTNAMLGAVWSAGFSQSTDMKSEHGDGFATRFGRKFGQNAIKSTGAYLGGQIFREDPRKTPPYLVMRTSPGPKGFFRRTGHALADNFISYRCRNACAQETDIRKVPALSRVLGSLASGFGGELLTHDRPDSTRHALRGAASAYGSTFVNALFVEFKPELSAFAGKAFTKIFGVR
jgi:hypothetical protein